MTNDRCGGIFASQVIRLIGNVYSETMRIYISGKRQLTYQSEHKI
jgi:hypothetical protein